MEHPSTQNNDYLLGQIDAKVSHLLSAFAVQKTDIKTEHDALHTRINAHADRLGRIERAYWKLAGVVSLFPVIGTIAGLVIAYLKLK